jgi:hypothetical protein
MASEGGGVAYFHFEHVSFLLQDYCAEGLAENFMMHILVDDVDAWWNHINQSDVVKKYDVKLWSIELQSWKMRDFCMRPIWCSLAYRAKCRLNEYAHLSHQLNEMTT